MTRSLVLEREALTELSEGDLSGVAGASGIRVTEITCENRRCERLVETSVCPFNSVELC